MSNYCECHETITCEWCRLTAENKRYREAIESVLTIENYGVATDYIKEVEGILTEALEGSK